MTLLHRRTIMESLAKTMRATLLVVLATAALTLAACSSTEQVSLLQVFDTADGSGLRLVFDHPCPQGGPISIVVEETDSEVLVTATATDTHVLDCGGSASSDVTTTEASLDTPLRGRTVMDGSTGEAVQVEP